MKATALLLELLRNGAQLWAEGDELRFRAPKEVLTPDLREQLSRHKPEIVGLLGQQAKYVLPSFAQQRLWFLDQFESDNPFYNEPIAVRLTGQLNVAALEQSLRELARRHQALRTTLASVEGQPLQVIDLAPSLAWTLPVIDDLRELPESERQAEARRLAEEEARRPFDLARGPVWRAQLLRLDPAEHVLLLTIHHIAFDGWSMGVLFRELAMLYEAFSEGKPSPLPELPIQYADFAVWQRQWLQGEELERQLSYWKQQFSGSTPMLELPTDRPRPPVETFRGARQSLTLSEPLTEALKELSRREGVTLFMTLLAAFQALLNRYTGQVDIVVGSPIANRNRAEIEGLIGFFVNTLALRTELSGDPTFEELLGRVREVTLGAYAHQDLPFEKLVEELKPERYTSGTPLFQVMFVLQNALGAELELAGLTTDQLEVDNGTAKFDLVLDAMEGPEGLRATLEYNTDLFDAATIERMLGHFETLLEGVVADPEQRLSELPLLTEAERRQLLVEWNDTGTDYPRDKCVHELFEEQAERTPDAVAVVFEDQQLTYRELNRRANRLAHHLQGLGVGPEAPVGICVERSLEMVVGLLGILKAGGAYVPLNPADPKERLAFMLQDARVSLLLTQQRLVESLPQHGARVLCLNRDSEAINSESGENVASRATAESLAYIIYTSGSTGKPKGVAVVHRGVVRLVKNTDYAELTANEVFLQFAPISFDASTFEVWGCLLNGARLVVFPANIPSLEELGQVLRQYQVTTLWLTAGLFHQVVDFRLEALRGVRQLLAGGDVLSVRHVEKFLQETEGCRLINGYGPTENTTFTCCYSMTDPSRVDGSVPIGRPIANTQVYILGSSLQPVPVGVTGELYIGGDGLARGYLNRPELTAEKFVPNPFSDEPGARLYKTGDLARYLPDGNVEFLGRLDHQVKIRGFRVEPGEVESVLEGRADVRESAVILRGEEAAEQKQLVAYVVPAGPSAPSPEELRAFLREKLPEHMVPSAFVALDALPLTPNGKVDRRALPAPDPSSFRTESTYAQPRMPAEEALAGIWEEVLGVERVGIDDDFFELGGHSLLAVPMMARLNRHFGVELPLRALFDAPTVARLALAVTQARAEAEIDIDQMLAEVEQAQGRSMSQESSEGR